jgi:hypothetical protein
VDLCAIDRQANNISKFLPTITWLIWWEHFGVVWAGASVTNRCGSFGKIQTYLLVSIVRAKNRISNVPCISNKSASDAHDP